MNKLQEVELAEMEAIDFSNVNEKPYEINSLSSLNWAFRMLSALKVEEKNTKQLADEERFRINTWEQAELSKVKNRVEYFEFAISQYHAKQLEENPKAKTISTPYGKSKSTTSKAQPEKFKEEVLLEFVKNNDLPFIETVEKLKWGELKKTLQVIEKEGKQIVIDENGETVPGAIVKPQTTTFKVEI
ncbi:host-nuclease inhibitor Gam family protein [Viridibacillus arvi]|uniref:host-nuclease inhibitor Gam family protein n=1 Tax=Viridibacillus arvi TaxID=263475 RepID=UPI003D02FCD4